MTTGPAGILPVQYSPYRYAIGMLAVAAHFSIGVSLFSVSPILLEIISDYGIGRGTAGFLVSLPLLVAALIGLPGGVITVKLGVRASYAIGWWMVGVAALSVVAPNFPALLGVRLLYGLGTALLLVATGPLLMRWFKPREILVMNGLNTAVLSLGIAVSVGSGAYLSSLAGWQATLGLYGLVGVLGAGLWSVLGREGRGETEVVTGISFSEIRDALKSRAVLLLLAADAGVLVQYTALSGWLPTYYTEVRGMVPEVAGFITGLLPFVGVFAVLLGAFLPLRFGPPRAYLIIPGLMVVPGGLGAFLLGYDSVVYLSLIVLGIGSWLYVPTLLSTPMTLAEGDSRKVAVVWGSLLTCSGACMFISPIMVGVLQAQAGSFLPGFLVCVAASSALLAAGVFLPQHTQR